MGLFDDGLKGNVFTALAIGIGTAVLGPIVIPVVVSVVKPIARAAIRGGLGFYEKGKEMVAEVGEAVEDLVAEVKAELPEGETKAAATIVGASAARKRTTNARGKTKSTAAGATSAGGARA